MATARPLNLQIDGASRLAATMRKAGINMKDLKAENKKAAQVVTPVAKGRAPRKSGALANSIRAGATQKAGVIRAGNNSKTRYAQVQEFGWPAHHIKAKHFVTEAASSTETKWTKVYEDAITKLINEIQGA